MKKLIVALLAVGLGFWGLSGVAMGGNPPVTSEAATVTVTVVTQLTITRDFHLNFPGVLVQGATKTVAPAGGGAGGSAQFTISGLAGAEVDITVPATVTVSNTGATMTVTLDPGATAGTQTLDATTGNHIVHVGGSVTAAPAQTPGDYTGTFTITAVYL